MFSGSCDLFQCSCLAIELTLTRPGKQVQVERDVEHSKDIDAHDEDLCIIVSCSLSSEPQTKLLVFVCFSYETVILTSFISLSMLLIYRK